MVANFVDARQLPDGTVVDTDLCVVGAGAAGITLSNEFANLGVRVCMVESGGLNFESHVQAQGDIQVIGRPYPSAGDCRLRYFGGTTNHWGGHCVPLEPIDFEQRPWISHSGWPIAYEDILPYYHRAVDVLQIGEFNYDAEALAGKLGLKLLPFEGGRVKTVVSRYNRIRFGVEFYETLAAANNIHVYLYASAAKLRLNENGGSVAELVTKTDNKGEIRFRSRYVVLAAGGIENPLLLLASRDLQPNGIGNGNDLVGRYFMDHLWYQAGAFLTPSGVPPYKAYFESLRDPGGTQLRFHLALTAAATRELAVPKFRAEISYLSQVGHAAHRLLRSGGTSSPDFALAIEDLLSHPISVARRVYDRNSPPFIYVLENYVEQIPNHNSRISLSAKTNALGNPLPQLDWQLSPIDKEGIVKAHRVIAQEIGRAGAGRFRYEVPEDEGLLLDGVEGGCHHMGTTRMSENPQEGVVDTNSRVHGIDNLYVAGSSVFPCAGWANPTMTIVALSLRLADHLRTQLDKGA